MSQNETWYRQTLVRMNQKNHEIWVRMKQKDRHEPERTIIQTDMSQNEPVNRKQTDMNQNKPENHETWVKMNYNTEDISQEEPHDARTITKNPLVISVQHTNEFDTNDPGSEVIHMTSDTKKKGRMLPRIDPIKRPMLYLEKPFWCLLLCFASVRAHFWIAH